MKIVLKVRLENYKINIGFWIFLLAFVHLFLPVGHAETLPERLTTENIMNYIWQNDIDTVDGLIAALPPLHKKNFILLFKSEALNKEFISDTYPKVVSWGSDSRFLLSWSTDPSSPAVDSVEFLQQGSEKWVAGVIDFSGQEPELLNPPICSTCHGDLNKPLWGDYPHWIGTEGEADSATLRENIANARSSTDPRLELLELDAERSKRVSSVSGKESSILNLAGELASTLIWRHVEVLLNKLKARSNYMQLAEQILCGEVSLNSLYDFKDHNIAAMRDGNSIKLIQQESDDNLSQHYSSGNSNMKTAFKFLILYDFWRQDARISDFYRMLANEEVSPLFFSYLNYFPRSTTAEEELVASYRQHFELEGQASLDARIDRGSGNSIGKTAVFGQGHLYSMAPRVCTILRQNSDDELPRVQISDNSVSEDEGEATLTVTLNSASAINYPIDVYWTTSSSDNYWFSSGSATVGVDYVLGVGKLTFYRGETSKNIRVEILRDNLTESPEGFEVVLYKISSNALLVDSVAQVSIVDRLPPPPPDTGQLSAASPPPSLPDSIAPPPPSLPDTEQHTAGGGCSISFYVETESISRRIVFNMLLMVCLLIAVSLRNLVKD